MKKVLVTYQVKDPDWWVTNNKLQQATAHLGFRFELFRKKIPIWLDMLSKYPMKMI